MEDVLKKMITLSQLAEMLNASLVGGDGGSEITGVHTIADAAADEVCFLSEAQYADQLAASKAAAVMTAHELADCSMAQLVVGNVNKSLIAVLRFFEPPLKPYAGIDPSASIDPTAVIDPTAAVAPRAVIAAGVTVGAHTVIGPGCSIGQETTIGDRCRLDANVVVYHRCKIGNDCIILSNSTIGATGFGYVFLDGRHQLIPHNGGVILEDGVEIGANTCVDRAKFGHTVIGAGTKIDNLVQVAHNVRMGRACLLAGQVGLAGSTTLGDGVVLAGAAGAADHLTIGSGVIAGARAVMTKDTPPGQKVLGFPARQLRDEMKSISIYQKLPELAKDVKTLAKKVEQLEAAKNH